MAETKSRHVSCPVLVLRIDEAQVTGDTLAEALRDEFLTLVMRTGAQHLVLDLGRVAYLSSAGFRPLLSVLREVRGRGGRLILCGLQTAVAETFQVTRLISSAGSGAAAFEVQADLPAALGCLNLSPPPAA
jgi:stage II sporulation protein AA (anti-sigma F factor antagonist)